MPIWPGCCRRLKSSGSWPRQGFHKPSDVGFHALENGGRAVRVGLMCEVERASDKPLRAVRDKKLERRRNGTFKKVQHPRLAGLVQGMPTNPGRRDLVSKDQVLRVVQQLRKSSRDGNLSAMQACVESREREVVPAAGFTRWRCFELHLCMVWKPIRGATRACVTCGGRVGKRNPDLT